MLCVSPALGFSLEKLHRKGPISEGPIPEELLWTGDSSEQALGGGGTWQEPAAAQEERDGTLQRGTQGKDLRVTAHQAGTGTGPGVCGDQEECGEWVGAREVPQLQWHVGHRR